MCVLKSKYLLNFKYFEVFDVGIDYTNRKKGFNVMQKGKRFITLIISAVMLLSVIFALSSCDCKHKWGEWTVTTEMTCTQDGWEMRVCSKCDGNEGHIIPAKGHTLVSVPGSAATCEADGRTDSEYCSDCGEVTVAEAVIPALGHKIKVIAGKAATCTEDGYTESEICERCNTVTKPQETVPAHNHTPEVIEGFPASCTADGLTDGSRCSVCETVLAEREVIPMFAHTEVPVPGYPATCTEWGLTDGVYCPTCDTMIVGQQMINAPGHDMKYVEGYAPTCERVGLSGYNYCARCGDNFGGPSVLPANGHIETIKQGYPATCTEPGRRDGVQCHTCHKTLVEGEEIPAKGHNVITTNGYAASCLSAGKTDGQMCNLCYTMFVEQEVIPALGHDVIVDTERTYGATCEHGGCTYYICSFPNCTYGDQKFTEALPHTEVIDPAVEPTLSSTGLTEGKHCAVCERVLVAQTVRKQLVIFTASSGVGGSVSVEQSIISPEADTITITATPDIGYAFEGWYFTATGAKASDEDAGKFFIWDAGSDYEKLNSVEARFYKLEVIVVNTNYGEPTVEGDMYYDVGERATLTAKVPDGYRFVGWYEGETRVSADLTIRFDVVVGGRTLEARYEKAYVFTLSNEYAEMGSVSWSSYNGEYGESSVYEGSRITLKATKNTNYVFVGWYDADGNLIASASSFNIYMPSGDYEIYAKFDYIYYEVKLGHNATNYVDEYATTSGSGSYHIGQTVNISVTYLPGVKFIGWYLGDECVSENTEYSFTMSSSATVTYVAKFERLEYTLTVVPNYPELEVLTKSVKFGDYIFESDHVDNDVYEFLGWYIDGERVKDYDTVMPAEDVTVEAGYLKSYAITTSVNNSYGYVNVVNMDLYDKSHYHVGDTIRLTASSSNGTYKFVCWMIDGEIVSTENPYMLTMPEGDVDITAIFGRNRYIFATKNYEDAPEPTVPEMALEFSQITAVAESNDLYKFIGWYVGGELLSKDSEYTFAMPEGGDLEIEARYAMLRSITADKNYPDAPEIDYPESAYEGDSVTVVASSDKKYRFVGWYIDENLLSADEKYTFDMPYASLSLNARYELIEYTLSVGANYGDITLTAPAEIKYNFGDTATLTADDLLPGYKFLGWYLDGKLVSLTREYEITLPASNSSLVATYAKRYSIDVLLNYADAADVDISENLYVGDKVTVSLTDIAEGYRFVGWYLDGELVSSAESFDFTMPERDAEIKAEFCKYRAINVNSNYEDAPIDGLPTGAYEGDEVTLTVTSNEVYRFVGWYLGGELVSSGESYSFEMPEGDVTLEAKFIKLYNINVNKNYPDSPEATYPNSAFEGKRVTVLAGESTKYYRFDGWYIDGELVSDEREYRFDMPSSDVTLEARYIKLYRVETSIDRDGTLTDRIDATYAPGEVVSVEAFGYEGYRFIGWYMGDELVSSNITYSFAMTDGNVTLVERYLKTYSVNVSVNYPEIEVSDSITGLIIGESVDLVASEPNEKYIFDGWYIGDERIADTLTVSVTVDGDACVEARYIEKHQVTFIGNDAEITGGGYYLANETVTVTAKANVGYRFDGWYIDGELVSTDKEYTFTMPDHDVEITLDIFEVWDGNMSDGFSGGSGTQDDPYLISHASELKYLAYLVNNVGSQNGYYKLIADIDMGGHEWEPIGTKHSGGAYNIYYNSFTGFFNGDGHTIKNYKITVTDSSTEYIGLFGGTAGHITNLTVSDFDINIMVYKSEMKIGAIAGYVYRGGIGGCYANGNITIIDIAESSTGSRSFYVGMIAGYIDNCGMTKSKSSGEISVNLTKGRTVAYVGGVLGGCVGDIQYCSSDAHITATTTTDLAGVYLGGVVGNNGTQGYVMNCYSKTTIETDCVVGSSIIGGVVASSNSGVSNCASYGSIYVKSGIYGTTVGGVLGVLSSSARRLESCFSATRIVVDGATDSALYKVLVGGIVGSAGYDVMYSLAANNITVTACDATINTTAGTAMYCYYYDAQNIEVSEGCVVKEYGSSVTLEQLNNKSFYGNVQFGDYDLSDLDFEAGKYPMVVIPE